MMVFPFAICLVGTKLDVSTQLFVGWFVPRDIASVLYLLLVVRELGVEGHERVLSVIVLTVLLSVILHGVSAVPLSNRYGSKQALQE